MFNVQMTKRLTLIMALIMTAELFGANSRVRLLPGTVCESGVVTLSQIAEITCEDEALQSRLEQLVIGKKKTSLNPDHMVITVFDINRTLMQAHIPPASLDLFGASECRIDFTGSNRQGINEEEIKPTDALESLEKQAAESKEKTLADVCTAMIARSTGFSVGQVVVDWDQRHRSFLEQTYDDARYEIRPRGHLTLGRVRFEIVEKDEQSMTGDRVIPVYVYGQVQVLGEVLIARRSLSPGHVITLDDVEVVCRRLTDLQDMVLDGVKSVIGKEVARPIRSQQVVRSDTMLRKMILVNRKDKISVRSTVGGVVIEMMGVALEDGSQGELIAVSSDTDRRNVIQARVTGSGIVETVGSRQDDDDEDTDMEKRELASSMTLPDKTSQANDRLSGRFE